VGESVVINDPDGEFKVTAFDANHCPGIFFFYIMMMMIWFVLLLIFNCSLVLAMWVW
jgi:hypothetical protein